jgi:hypothetical protein
VRQEIQNTWYGKARTGAGQEAGAGDSIAGETAASENLANDVPDAAAKSTTPGSEWIL